MLKGHLPRVIYHQVYEYTKIITTIRMFRLEEFVPRMLDVLLALAVC